MTRKDSFQPGASHVPGPVLGPWVTGEQGLVINPLEKNETEFGGAVLWGVVEGVKCTEKVPLKRREGAGRVGV